jgi:two-component system sensor histidine kinase CpxA
MITKISSWKKRIFLGISIKLFIAFWFAIALAVLISYLVTMQVRSKPVQEQANPQQLKVLNQFKNNLSNKKNTETHALQLKFFKRFNQYLLVKNLSNGRVYVPKKRGWHKVKNYLESNPLENPVTVDFSFTQVTSSKPINLNGKPYQLFIANKLQPGFMMGVVKQLPVTLRFLFLIIISFLFCWLLAKSFTTPLIALQQASKAIGEGKLTTRINKFDKRADEFGDLARSFNQMAEQLENNISAHQRLLGDVSHELRSPLTRLQLAIALTEKNKGNEIEQQKHLMRCETEIDRLEEMIADVLTLSRLEHHQNNYAPEEVNINKLVKYVIDDCQYLANSKDISIRFEGNINTILFADSKLLASAISNIINNAVKYSPSNDVVFVSLIQDNNLITLSILDNGPGVPDETLDKLFKPFYRVADGRERNSGGTGLGLAIAQPAIVLHGGKVVAENISDGGFKVTITIPT